MSQITQELIYKLQPQIRCRHGHSQKRLLLSETCPSVPCRVLMLTTRTGSFPKPYKALLLKYAGADLHDEGEGWSSQDAGEQAVAFRSRHHSRHEAVELAVREGAGGGCVLQQQPEEQEGLLALRTHLWPSPMSVTSPRKLSSGNHSEDCWLSAHTCGPPLCQ